MAKMKVTKGPDLTEPLLMGMAEAMAFSRIDKLVRKEKKRLAKGEQSERLKALLDARSLFGRVLVEAETQEKK